MAARFDDMDDEAIARHVLTLDLGDRPDEGYVDRLLGSIRDGKATILRRQYGFAVVFPEHPHLEMVNGRLASPKRTELEILFVSPEFQGTGVAQRFMAEIIELYGQEWPIFVTCFAEWRRRFFEKQGFEVQEEYDGPAFFMSWSRAV